MAPWKFTEDKYSKTLEQNASCKHTTGVASVGMALRPDHSAKVQRPEHTLAP